ncbi:MAG: pseudouridine synthase [Hyphomicrobiales bacterium]
MHAPNNRHFAEWHGRTPPVFTYKPPADEGLVILNQDDDLLLVDKPAGLLSVPGKAADHADCLEARVKTAFPQALLVHRLDLDTSGIMVFAMNSAAQRHLGLQFERRHIEKRYVARVAGHVTTPIGQIDLPLICDWPNRPLQKVDWEQGKNAQTRFEVLSKEGEATRLALFPKTGRSHQLRVHCLALGHPILGDPFYAPPEQQNAAPRMQLHAETLSLFHPTGGERLVIETTTPF